MPSNAPLTLASAATLFQGLVAPQLPTSTSHTATLPRLSASFMAKPTWKLTGTKQHFGESKSFRTTFKLLIPVSVLQVEFPLHTMSASKDVVLRIMDIPEELAPVDALSTITSEMGVDIKIHKIAYKTSKMKVKEDAATIDCLDAFVAGLEIQRNIQARAFEQKRLKIFNLVSLISIFSSLLLSKYILVRCC
jgi:hypothetical protein